MSISVSRDAINSAKDFIGTNATKDESGDYRLTAKQHDEFMKSLGITPEVLRSVSNAQSTLLTGGYAFLNDKNVAGVAAAKAAGDDPKAVVTKLRIGTDLGSIKMTQEAVHTYTAFGKPGETMDKTNVTTVKIDERKGIDKAFVAECEAAMREHLGL